MVGDELRHEALKHRPRPGIRGEAWPCRPADGHPQLEAWPGTGSRPRRGRCASGAIWPRQLPQQVPKSSERRALRMRELALWQITFALHAAKRWRSLAAVDESQWATVDGSAGRA